MPLSENKKMILCSTKAKRVWIILVDELEWPRAASIILHIRDQEESEPVHTIVGGCALATTGTV